MNRRTFLTSAAAFAALPLGTVGAAPPSQKLGLSIASYMIRWRHRDTPQESWQDALDVLDHCANTLDAGCLQIGVHGWQNDFAGKVRDRREQYGITLEGQIGLPKTSADVERFTQQVKQAKEAGAKILRTVCLGGRRYETFHSLDEWKTFRADSMARLELAEPVIRREGVTLAVENHKDWRSAEFVEILRHLDSEHVGVNFDFGNNLALLEDPVTVAETLAPWIRTTHIKNMGVADHEEGFLLSEVPFGGGILDLPKLVSICRSHYPEVQFNLEMITRDPLVIPCLTENYRATMPDLPEADLRRTLDLVKNSAASRLPRVAEKDHAAQIAFEEQNNRACFSLSKAQNLLSVAPH
jgi:sugar phosphate isomerase/epimerase